MTTQAAVHRAAAATAHLAFVYPLGYGGQIKGGKLQRKERERGRRGEGVNVVDELLIARQLFLHCALQGFHLILIISIL